MLKTSPMVVVIMSVIPFAGALGAVQVLWDFEGSFEGWTRKDAFPGVVSTGKEDWERRCTQGFHGSGFIATGGQRWSDKGTGSLISPEFTISKRYLLFRMGGGLHPNVRLDVLVGSKAVAVAYCNNAWELAERTLDLGQWQGQSARLEFQVRHDYRCTARLDYVRIADEPGPALAGFGDPLRREESSLMRAGEFRCILEASKAASGKNLYNSSMVYGHDNAWHVYAVVGPDNSQWNQGQWTSIVHSKVADLASPQQTDFRTVLTVDGAKGENGLFSFDVIFHQNRYYMFYVGRRDKGFSELRTCQAGELASWEGKCGDNGPYHLYLATSNDGVGWTRDGELFMEGGYIDGPKVCRVNDKWVMYYGGNESTTNVNSKQGIVCRTSTDLRTWANRKIALAASENAVWTEHPFWGQPIVFRRGTYWYLLCGPTSNNNYTRYHALKVYRSGDPFAFTTQNSYGWLLVDGCGKVVRDGAGDWFVTTSHIWGALGGVWAAPLAFNDGQNSGPFSIEAAGGKVAVSPRIAPKAFRKPLARTPFFGKHFDIRGAAVRTNPSIGIHLMPGDAGRIEARIVRLR